MATYKVIQEYVRATFGYTPKACWIAHAKELNGLSPRVAYNRYNKNERKNPCPENKQEDIKRTFQHFGMIE